MSDRCAACGGVRGGEASMCRSCSTAAEQISSRAAAERDALDYLMRQRAFRTEYPGIGSRALSG